jgi:tetratricopeptide (TPR) repeat protein
MIAPPPTALKLVPALLSALLFCLAPEQVRSQDDAGMALRRGEEALAAGDPELAIEILSEGLRRGGPFERQAFAATLAEAHLRVGEAKEALALLEGPAKGPTAPPQVLYLAAEAHAALGATARAEELWRRLESMAPTATVAHRLGVVQFERGEPEKALESFRRALALEPADYYSAIYEARALLELDRPAEAAAALARIEASASAERDYLLGRCALNEKRLDVAIAAFRAALERQPAYAEAAFGLATALRRAGREEEARREFARFEELHRAEWRQLQQASALAQTCLREPGKAEPALAAARFHLESGTADAAQRHAWQALRIAPALDEARLVLARALARAGSYREAVVHYRKLLSGRPDDAEVRSELEGLLRAHARPIGGRGR